MKADRRSPLRGLGLALVAVAALIMTACSSTPSAAPLKILHMDVQGNSSIVINTVARAMGRYAYAANSTDPNDFENAGAATRYAASVLNDPVFPSAARQSVQTLRAALLKLSADLEQAAAPDADLANVKQVTAMDAADAGRAEHVLLTKLSSARKETASESDLSACMALRQWAVVLSRDPQTMPTAAAHPALFANLAAAARTAHTPELRQVAKGLMTDGFVAGPGDLGQRVTRRCLSLGVNIGVRTPSTPAG